MDRSAMELLIRSLSHEIKNPLTTIKGYLQLSQIKKDEPGFLEKSADVMMSQTDRIEKILDALYPVFCLKAGDKERVNLYELVYETVMRKDNPFTSRVTLQIEKSISIETDPLLFSMIIDSIVNKFGRKASPDAGVTVKTVSGGSVLAMSFDGTDFSHIWEKGTFTPYAYKYPYTTGIELCEAYWIAQELGFTLDKGDAEGEFILEMR